MKQGKKILKARIHFLYGERNIKVFPITEDELKSPATKGFLYGMVVAVVLFLLSWVLTGLSN